MSPALALWQEVVLAGLAIFALSYALLFRIGRTRPAAADGLSLFALAITVSSVALPAPFSALSRFLIETSPLPAALSQADAKVAALEALPGELLASALARIGYEPDEEEIPTEAEAQAAGPFTSTIRPSVDSLVTAVLRTVGAFGGGFMLVVGLVLRIGTAALRRTQRFADRIAQLEAERRVPIPAPSGT